MIIVPCRVKKSAAEAQFYLKRKNLVKANCENSNENPLPISFIVFISFFASFSVCIDFLFVTAKKDSLIQDDDEINTKLCCIKWWVVFVGDF